MKGRVEVLEVGVIHSIRRWSRSVLEVGGDNSKEHSPSSNSLVTNKTVIDMDMELVYK